MKLAIAFGARGKGKALAHYEPSRAVINLTKMKGAGCLAHEWGHAFDDYLGHKCGLSGLQTYLSVNCGKLIKASNSSPVVSAMYKLVKTMQEKVLTLEEYIEYLEESISKKELALEEIEAKATARKSKGQYGATEIADLYKAQKEKINTEIRSAQILIEDIKSGKHTTTKIVKTNFYTGAQLLDKNRQKPYYSQTVEMFARCFETYIETKLKSQGLINKYLVHSTGNSSYFGYTPYPEGREQENINKAIEELLETSKQAFGHEFGKVKGMDFSNYGSESSRVSYRNSIKTVNKKTGEELPKEKREAEKKNESKTTEINIVDKNSLREALVNIGGNTTNRGGISRDYTNIFNLFVNKIKFKLGYEVIAIVRDSKEVTFTGNSKAFALEYIHNAKIICYDKVNTTKEKQMEAVIEALATIIITDKYGKGQMQNMLIEGVTYAVSKNIGLDVRTYCLSGLYDELAKNKQQALSYYNMCKKIYAEIFELVSK